MSTDLAKIPTFNKVKNLLLWPIQKKDNFICTSTPIITFIALNMTTNISYFYYFLIASTSVIAPKFIFHQINTSNKKTNTDQIYQDSIDHLDANLSKNELNNIMSDSNRELYDNYLKNKSGPLLKTYIEEIDSRANTFASLLKKTKKIEDATLFNHNKFKIVYGFSENKEYYNILNKTYNIIDQDLKIAITSKLGGKQVVEKLIQNIEDIIKNSDDFYEGIEAEIKKNENILASELQSKNNDLLTLDKRLKTLDNQKKQFVKEKYDEKRKEIFDIAKIDIEKKKQKIINEIKYIFEQRAKMIKLIPLAYLSNLNAQRRELGKLINKNLEDIITLPILNN